jgi:hypothetical protein
MRVKQWHPILVGKLFINIFYRLSRCHGVSLCFKLNSLDQLLGKVIMLKYLYIRGYHIMFHAVAARLCSCYLRTPLTPGSYTPTFGFYTGHGCAHYAYHTLDPTTLVVLELFDNELAYTQLRLPLTNIEGSFYN